MFITKETQCDYIPRRTNVPPDATIKLDRGQVRDVILNDFIAATIQNDGHRGSICAALPE
jgi:hypothetical protein